VLFALGILMPAVLAGIPWRCCAPFCLPSASAASIRWSFRLLRDTLFRRDRRHSRTAWKNLAIIGAVTTMTRSVADSGLLTGIVLSV
jgi:hypothetical protein